MRFGLKGLLLILTLLGIGGAAYFASSSRRQPGPYYSGQLTRNDLTLDVVRQFDPEVKISGGGGGGGSARGQSLWKAYRLTSTQPINDGYFESLRIGLLEALRRHGVRVLMENGLPVPVHSSDRHELTPSFGYEVLVEDQGFRGLVAIRLMPTKGGVNDSGYGSGYQAELHENIVVFPRD